MGSLRYINEKGNNNGEVIYVLIDEGREVNHRVHLEENRRGVNGPLDVLIGMQRNLSPGEHRRRRSARE